MQIELVPIARVIPYARNPRRNEGAIAKVAASIREFGFRQPIVVDPEMVIVVGHTRLEAARKLGLAEVPVHVAHGLSPAQLKAYRIADNRLHEEAEWDEELLECELLELKELDFDLGLTGFDDDEIGRLLDGSDLGILPDADEDRAPELPEAPETEPGELIVLGRHRLLCGDTTSVADMARLMTMAPRADMVFTDPPYNVGYEHEKRAMGRVRVKKFGAIANDSMEPGEYADFLRKALGTLAAALTEGGAAYVCHAEQESVTARGVFAEFFHTASVIIWDKGRFALGAADYHWQHEPIIYGWRLRGRHQWYGDRKQSTVWALERDPSASYVHPMQKPVGLAERAIRNSSPEGGVVLDGFGGSGSTLIAAEKLGRRACVMELDPGYCDVIVRRWETATGKHAIRHKPSQEVIEPSENPEHGS
jgi:DNA modification methylase